jgi:hypothetical protein
MKPGNERNKIRRDEASFRMRRDEASCRMRRDEASCRMRRDEASCRMRRDEASYRMRRDEASYRMRRDEASYRLVKVPTDLIPNGCNSQRLFRLPRRRSPRMQFLLIGFPRPLGLMAMRISIEVGAWGGGGGLAEGGYY